MLILFNLEAVMDPDADAKLLDDAERFMQAVIENPALPPTQRALPLM